MCQRKGIEQWQQCEAFFCIFPTQPEFDGEMDLRVFFYCGGQQIFYLVRIRQPSRRPCDVWPTLGKGIPSWYLLPDNCSRWKEWLSVPACRAVMQSAGESGVFLPGYSSNLYRVRLYDGSHHVPHVQKGNSKCRCHRIYGVCQPIYRVCIALERSEMYR